MPPRVLAVLGSLVLLGLVIELVRRRSLKEEYSLLWILTALVLLGLSLWFGLLVSITRAIGAIAPSSTLFFFGLVFALLMLLHFSVRVSLLERRLTALVQELGLISAERQAALEEERRNAPSRDADNPRVAGERPRFQRGDETEQLVGAEHGQPGAPLS
jgi:hypothetical protein